MTAPEKNPLCARISEEVRRARSERWKGYYRSISKNRRYASGRVGEEIHAEDRDGEEPLVRANLTYATMHGLLQHVYARDPDISAAPSEAVPPTMYRVVRGFARTVEIVLSRQLKDGGLKPALKLAVLSALTCKVGWLKVTYQRDYRRDPIIHARLQDAQDNLARVEQAIRALEQPQGGAEEHDAKAEELRQMVAALENQTEVMVAEGLVVDVVRPEDITLDPAMRYLYQHDQARWIDERIWRPREDAEALCGRPLERATVYQEIPSAGEEPDRLSGSATSGLESRAGARDGFVALHETWHRQSQTVYTWVEGENDWARSPMSPEALGQKWDPYFSLGFYPLDGEVLPLSLVEMVRELQDEYNATRTQLAEHRAVSIPHWIADKATDRDTIERYVDAKLGEVVLVDAQGRPLREVIEIANPPPFDPRIYDTTPIRADFDLVSGLSDAQRGAVMRAKTATEASIVNAGLGVRTEEMQDCVEDVVTAIAVYAKQVLLQELTLPQVQRIAGPMAVWPELAREEIYDLVTLTVRGGSMQRPNRAEEREQWVQLLPLILQLQTQIMQMMAAGMDPAPTVRVLEETIHRFDEHLDVEEFLPAGAAAPGGGMGAMMPQAGGQANVIPFPGGGGAPAPMTQGAHDGF